MSPTSKQHLTWTNPVVYLMWPDLNLRLETPTWLLSPRSRTPTKGFDREWEKKIGDGVQATSRLSLMNTVPLADKQDQRNNLQTTFTMIVHVCDEIYNAKENIQKKIISTLPVTWVTKTIHHTIHVPANLWAGSASDLAGWWCIWRVSRRTIIFTDTGEQKQQHLIDVMMVLSLKYKTSAHQQGKTWRYGRWEANVIHCRNQGRNYKVIKSHNGWNETLLEPWGSRPRGDSL